jgi:hypothetical protein
MTVATLEPGPILRVTRLEVEAAKLKLALDKSMGRASDPRVVAIANAKRVSSPRPAT